MLVGLASCLLAFIVSPTSASAVLVGVIRSLTLRLLQHVRAMGSLIFLLEPLGV